MTSEIQDLPASPQRIDFHSRDADEFMSMFGRLHAPVHAQLGNSTAFEMSSEMIVSGGLCISRTITSDVDLQFNDIFDGYGLTLPTNGEFVVGHSSIGSLEAAAGFGLMVDSRSITAASMKNGCDFTRISVDTNELHKRVAALSDRPIIKRVQFSPLVSLGGNTASLAAGIVKTIQGGLAGDAPLAKYPAALTSLREALLNLMVEGLPHSYSDHLWRKCLTPSPRHVTRAIDYMVAHAMDPLRLPDIALVAGCSVRSLQSGFMQFKGMAPMAYLRMLRLAGVRAELIGGNGTRKISDVAYSWGFPHLSLFAAYYTKAYGESPSSTRRRGLN